MAEVKTELQQIAINEKNRAQKEQFIRAVDTQWLDSRMEGSGMSRCLALIQREKEMEKDNQEKLDHAAIINTRADREMALAREIELEKRRCREELAHREFLRANDPELKTLAVKLRAGYVCRDRRQQIADNEYRRLQEKIEEHHSNSVMKKSLTNDKETEDKELREDKIRKTCYRKELWRQMDHVESMKQRQIQNKAIEKKMLDAMVKRFQDEDTQQLELKMKKRRELYCEMLSSLKDRDEWKEVRRQQALEKQRQLKLEQAEADNKKSGVAAERARKFQIKEEINRKVGEKLLADMKAIQERTDLIQELRELELEEKNVQFDEAEKIKELQVKRDNKAALLKQMNVRQQEREREKQNDMVYRTKNEETVAKEDAKERDKQQKRKEVMRKYSVELARQREEDRKRKQVERQENEDRNVSVWTSDTIQRELVRQERQKLLEEHAPHVLGYLQAGVLQKEDLPAVRRGANAHPHLAGLDIEAMGKRIIPKKIKK